MTEQPSGAAACNEGFSTDWQIIPENISASPARLKVAGPASLKVASGISVQSGQSHSGFPLSGCSSLVDRSASCLSGKHEDLKELRSRTYAEVLSSSPCSSCSDS